jgi:hypothetical protein
VQFQCKTYGGGRCETMLTYWDARGGVPVCPSWRARPDDDDRGEALLAGLYGYYRLVDDDRRR